MRRITECIFSKREKICAATVSAALLLTSCALLPVEEELPEAPAVSSRAEYGYTTAPVERGDMVREVSAKVEYQPSTEEKLFFSLDGERIAKLYVEKGDTVQKGQLIAELEMGDIPAQISQQEKSIREMELEQTHLEETLALLTAQNTKKEEEAEKKVQDAQAALEDAEDLPADDKKELEQALQDASRELEMLESQNSAAEGEQQEKITSLTEQLEVKREKLQELESKKKERQLYSSIDGTVQSALNVESNPVSSTSMSVAVIQNYATAVFVLEGDNCQYFKKGEKVDIILKDDTASSATVTKKVEGEKPEVHFSLDVPDPSLGKSSSGVVKKVLEKKEDVLYVPAEAVVRSGEKAYVYTLDENSLRCRTEVETGMEAEDYIEITKGLQEGDAVIVE